MSIEFKLDILLNYIFTWFTTTLPITVIPYIMSFYVYMTELLSAGFKQLCVTANAIQDSFDEKYIGYFEVGSKYIPVLINKTDKYTTEPKWTYNMNTQFFSSCEIGHHTRTFNLPYIGASLSRKENNTYSLIGDMSDWIMEQKIYADDGIVPLQLMVSAWLYSKNGMLTFNYEHLYITLITDTGDEITYDVENSMEVKREDIDESLSSTPSASSRNEDEYVEETKID